MFLVSWFYGILNSLGLAMKNGKSESLLPAQHAVSLHETDDASALLPT